MWYQGKLQHHSHDEILALYGIAPCLPYIVHRPVDIAMQAGPPACAVQYLCTTNDCHRCNMGLGGYVFRWFSPHWMQGYMDHRREGSWRPGDSEDAG